jgi:hypothetical protein
MPRIQKKIKRPLGVVLTAKAICSGKIERIQNSDTTHSIKRSSTPDYNSISSHSPQNTTVDRGFSAPTFEAAIGGGV